MNTLARALGETAHLSPLARRLKRFGFPTSDEWRQLAVQRGCRHYQTASKELQDPGRELISNEELIVALLLGANAYDPDLLRIAGQLLGGAIDEDRLIRLAKKERVLRHLRYVVDRARELEPEEAVWKRLCARTPECDYDPAKLPHRTRFAVPLRMGSGSRLRQELSWKWLRPGS